MWTVYCTNANFSIQSLRYSIFYNNIRLIQAFGTQVIPTKLCGITFQNTVPRCNLFCPCGSPFSSHVSYPNLILYRDAESVITTSLLPRFGRKNSLLKSIWIQIGFLWGGRDESVLSLTGITWRGPHAKGFLVEVAWWDHQNASEEKQLSKVHC